MRIKIYQIQKLVVDWNESESIW